MSIQIKTLIKLYSFVTQKTHMNIVYTRKCCNSAITEYTKLNVINLKINLVAYKLTQLHTHKINRMNTSDTKI